MLVTLRR